MIVLSRRCNEAIVIGDDIIVIVIEIRGDRVRLGIEAPRDCSIHRREFWSPIYRAGNVPPPDSLPNDTIIHG